MLLRLACPPRTDIDAFLFIRKKHDLYMQFQYSKNFSVKYNLFLDHHSVGLIVLFFFLFSEYLMTRESATFGGVSLALHECR